MKQRGKLEKKSAPQQALTAPFEAQGRSGEDTHTHDNKAQADCKSMRTATNVDELTQRQFADTGDDRSDQIYHSREIVLPDIARDVWLEGHVDVLLQRVDEADQCDSSKQSVGLPTTTSFRLEQTTHRT
jgi:hypothetical protein